MYVLRCQCYRLDTRHTQRDYDYMAYCLVRPHRTMHSHTEIKTSTDEKNERKKTQNTDDDEEKARMHVMCVHVCVCSSRKKMISAQYHIEFNTYENGHSRGETVRSSVE